MKSIFMNPIFHPEAMKPMDISDSEERESFMLDNGEYIIF